MFRAQQNAFDEAVAKATDENLTSENWEYILDVCDKANSEATGPKEVVGALIKRLAHRNANVQLYTLELANSLSQNCDVNVHRELASRSFTDALLRLAGDRTTHQQVKAKILERMQEWTEMFARNPELGIMEQAYMRLKTQNPNLHPPSKPTKTQITDADRRKEEEELQMALELSVKQQAQPAAAGSGNGQTAGTPTPGQQQTPQPVPSGTTAATVSRVRALFDFQPSEPGELQFKKGDIIAVLESVYKDWWKGSLRGQTGIFPLNYVEKLSDPTQEELQREAQMEAEVFAEIKNVEKLLTLLSTSTTETNVRDSEEITTLYHSTLAIRPKLIELIGKYSQRKDDFTQLNEKFIKARRDYEALLEASMAQPPPQPGYGRPGQYGYPPMGYQQGPPPAQQDPNRYYSPNPQDPHSHIPQNGPQPFYIAGQTPAPQHTQQPLQHQLPPQQQPQQPQLSYPSAEPRTDTPSARPTVATDQYAQPPSGTYNNPQELGTSTYASPVDGRRPSYSAYRPPQQQTQAPPPQQHQQQQQHQQPPPQQQQPPPQQQPQAQPQQQGSAEYSPSVYGGPEEPYTSPISQHPPSSNPYPAPLSVKPHGPPYGGTGGGGEQPPSYGAPPGQGQPQQQQPPPQPQSQPPPPPQQQQQQSQYGQGQSYAQTHPPQGAPPQQPQYAQGGGYPGGQPSPSSYPNLSGAPPQQYQAYQPPRTQEQGQGYAAGGNPNDYYR